MRGRLLAMLGVIGGVFAAGGLVGEVQYRQVVHPTALCGTCHHGTMDANAPNEAHSTDLGSICHVCHVFPVREYLEWTTESFLGAEPTWVARVSNPIVADQTCLECHLARERGGIVCETCHKTGSNQVDLGSGCEGCHGDCPLVAPHQDVACWQCHPDAMQGLSQMSFRKEEQP